MGDTEIIEEKTEETQVEPEEIQEETQIEEKSQETEEKPKESKKKNEYTERVAKDMIKLRKRAQAAEREAVKLRERIATIDNKPARPRITEFKSINEYGEEVINYEAYDQAIENYENKFYDYRMEQRQAEEIKSNVEADRQEDLVRYADQITELSKEYPDLPELIKQDIFGQELADAIYEGKESGKLALYLGKNKEEALRLSELGFKNERQMIRELGQLEQKINSLTKSISNAPPPINPVDESTSVDVKQLKDIEDPDKWHEEWKRQRIKELGL